MKATLTKETRYDGFGWQTLKSISEPIVVLGVMHPVDPGVVEIERNGKRTYAAEFAIEPNPGIDWKAMLTPEQDSIRQKLGGLLGNGVGGERKLIPIEQCPRRKGGAK